MVASTHFSHEVQPGAAPVSPAVEASLHDATLVQRFNAGDEGAFVEIVTRYRERMFAVAFSLLRNRADAEEIAQDTFVRAHRGLGSFRGESSLATWLHRIALNLARNRYWHRIRRRHHLTHSLDVALGDDASSTLVSRVACAAPGPVREAATTEFNELVDVCMQRLGPHNRDILSRRTILNCSYREIARTFGISVGTVKSRIARAREHLRIQLTQACPDYSPQTSPAEWLASLRPSGQLEQISP